VAICAIPRPMAPAPITPTLLKTGFITEIISVI
jgi:hypothetical protein